MKRCDLKVANNNSIFQGVRVALTALLLLGVGPWNHLHAGKAAAAAKVDVEVAFPALSFDHPVDLQHPGDGTDRLFVLEQPGVIKVFENSQSIAFAGTFLDIRDKVDYGGEKGLLGLAFHPDYKNNGYFYLDYTAPNPLHTVIARYQVNPQNPNLAERDSELILLEISQPYSNHNGGQIVFGPDGYLYIAMGDGGSGGDPQGNGQNRRALLGKLLRIDVDQPAAGRNYGIPADNPFAGNTQGFREEIYAYGLRNPWRFSFDPVTGWLWVADVGQNRIEEVDIVTKGKNYGWNIMEGASCYEPSSGCDTTGLVMPIWEYTHALGASITGGFVYRGSAVSDLLGAYIYGDYVSGRIWSLRYDGQSTAVNTQILDTDLLIASFGVDRNNELYICTFDNKIYRFKATTTGGLVKPPLPSAFSLAQNCPNPFNSSTAIHYALSTEANVRIEVYNLEGQLVRTLENRHLAPGSYSVKWSGESDGNLVLPSGLYFYRLQAGAEAFINRMVLLR